jgi:PAS domain S-box-containing protein
MKKVIIYIIIIFPLLIGAHPYQDSYWFERVDLNQFVKNEKVYSLTQDSIGYMWIGAMDGLYRYDGQKVINYNNLDKFKDLKLTKITRLYTDQDGNIWIGLASSLKKYSPDSNKFMGIELPERLGSYKIIDEDNKNIFVAGMRGEIIQVDKNSLSSRLLDTLNTQIWDIYYYENGLFLATGSGLLYYDLLTNKVHHNIISDRCYSLTKINDDEIVIGLKSKLIFFNLDENRIINEILLTGISQRKKVFRVCKDSNNQIWISIIGQKPHIYNLETKKLRKAVESNGVFNLPVKAPIFDIYQSRSGTIWICSTHSGLYKSRMLSKVKHLDGPNIDFNNAHVKVLSQDNQGKIWIGTQKRGVYIYDPETNKYSNLRDIFDLPHNTSTYDRIFCLFQDGNNMWVGGDKYLTSISRRNYNKKTYKIPDSLIFGKRSYIKSITKTGPDQYLLGTLGSGIIKFDVSSSSFARLSKNFTGWMLKKGDRINCGCIEQDDKGNIWAGMYKVGIIIHNLSKDKITKTLKFAGIKVNNILYEDSSRIWICSRKGLFHYNYDKDTYTHYSADDGLLSNNVLDITKMDSTNYWLSTNLGVVKFNPASKTFINYGDQYNFKYFVQPDQDVSNKQIIEENTLLLSRDNYIYVGGVNGIDKFRPQDVQPKFTPPKIHLTGMSILGRDTSFSTPFPELEKVKLSYQDYKFKFKYNIFSYHMPDNNQLSYKLEGYNTRWITTSNRDISFSNVPAGKYILKTKGSDAFSNWNDGQSIKITITPPFWNTPPFFIAAALLSALLVFSVIKLRTKSIEHQKRVLNRKVRIKTEELSKKKDELQKAHDQLEDRVKARTKQLLNSNKRLREEVAERKKVQKALSKSRKDLENNLRQQEILADISFSFNTTKEFREKVENALEKIIGYINTDRIRIYQKIKDKEVLEPAFEKISNPKCNSKGKRIIPFTSKLYKYYKEYFESHEMIKVEDTRTLPPAIADKFQSRKVRSFLAFPLYIEDTFFGIIAPSNCDSPHKWSSGEINFMRTISHLLSNAYQKEDIEKNLIRSERISRSLVNAPKEPSILLDENGTTLLINESFADILDTSKKELIGERLSKFLPDDIIEAGRPKVQQSFQEQKPVDFEIQKEDDYYSVSIYPVTQVDEEPSTAAIFIRNITAQKEAEQILKNNQEKLEELVDKRTKELHQINVKLKKEIDFRKMAEKELVANEKKKRKDLRKLTLQLAHEIKNPLASIKSSAQLLKYLFENGAQFSNQDKILNAMGVINSNVDTCNKVVQELYNYTHRRGMELKDNNLDVVLDEIVNYALNKADHSSNIQVKTNFEIEKANLSLDLFKILQAFKNLINNAFDAIEEKGIIRIHSKRNNQMVQVLIEDNGSGIKESHMKNLFEPFFTTKVKGFGIGLSVVKEIIEGHDGTLSIESEYGEGTIARVELPIVNK